MSFTAREKLCTELLANGFSAKQIAEKVHLSARTIESHIKSAKMKLCCNKNAQLIYLALKGGYIK